jgi:hypothetical protein
MFLKSVKPNQQKLRLNTGEKIGFGLLVVLSSVVVWHEQSHNSQVDGLQAELKEKSSQIDALNNRILSHRIEDVIVENGLSSKSIIVGYVTSESSFSEAVLHCEDSRINRNNIEQIAQKVKPDSHFEVQRITENRANKHIYKITWYHSPSSKKENQTRSFLDKTKTLTAPTIPNPR